MKIIKEVTNYLSELSNVINGDFYDNKYNTFWKIFFEQAKHYMSMLYTALEPGIQAIKRMFPSKNEMGESFNFLGKVILGAAHTISWLILQIEKLKKIIDFFGADNIIVFITVFMGATKVVGIIYKLVTAFKTLKAAGGILVGIKTAMMALIANPWVLIIGAVIAAIVTLVYVVYKNWDAIKNFILNIVDIIKGYIASFFNIFGELLPFKALKAFWDTWDSGKSITENLKNGIIAYVKVFSDFLPIKIVKQFFNIWTSEMSVVDKVKLSFTQTFDTIKNSINGVIGVVNKLGDKIKEIPIIKELLGALEIGIKPDGSHRNGLSYVPYDNYIAQLHKGERVLTAEENEQYGSLFNRLTPAPRGSSNTSGLRTSTITFSPSITINMSENSNAQDLTRTLEEKLRELESEFIRKIRELERRGVDERRTKF